MLKNFFLMAALTALVASAPLSPLSAQQMEKPDPFISVSSSSVVKVTPDRATIHISVQTRHETAAGAASENATKQTAVIAALKGLNLRDDQISTVNYNVSPNYRHEQNREPILTGYTVTNTIVVELHDIKQVGQAIDVSLKNGANNISSLNFYAANTDSARQAAIAQAVQKARAEAQVAAQAAGGSLGSLLDININSDMPFPPRPMYARAEALSAAADMATPINPGDQSVVVTIYTRWKYVTAQ